MANQAEARDLQHWSNSDGFLQQVENKRIEYLYYSEAEDVEGMILKIRSYLTLIQAIDKSDRELFDRKSPNSAYKIIEKARKLYDMSQRSNQGDPVVARRNRKKKVEALEILRELFDSLMKIEGQDLKLIFKELDDPNLTLFGG